MPRTARPSPSMAVALVALFVALGGTSYAVSRIDGRQLKSASVSGSKLRRNTLGGREIREAALGTVARPRPAAKADRATSAALADRAGTADSALALSDTAAAGLTIARSAAD